MKIILRAAGILCLVALYCSCSKDSGKLPHISFKTGSSYVSGNRTIGADSTFIIGIDASKAEPDDVLKKFNITKSVNGAAAITLVDETLTGGKQDNYSYELTEKADSVTGLQTQYVFSVVNRDGLVNKLSLTTTIK